MNRRRVLATIFGIVFCISLALFAISKWLPSRLPEAAGQDLRLVGVVFAAVIAGLAGLNETWELVQKLLGRQTDHFSPDKAQVRIPVKTITHSG